MDYVYQKGISEEYSSQVFKMICDSNNDFVPPLSGRNSTTQSDLSSNNASSNDLPYDYFKKIKNQSTVLCVEGGKVLGFMSIIENHGLTLGDKEYNAVYLSTLIVDKECRGRHLSVSLYNKLIETFNDRNIITRTWSTNVKHLSLLGKLGFNLLHTVKNDRGNGIDTVYYGKII